MLRWSVVLVLLNIMLSSAFHARVSRVSSIVRSFPRFNHQLHAAFLQSMKDRENKKFVVVTGGVISGIGKGITASSVGVLMKMLGLRPTAIKIDPYLNIDAGTMSPSEHGEVFVLDDGAETDLDLGNYERFLDVSLANDSNLTTGKIYQSVIQRERNGEYLGKTVQIIPHITNEIMERILEVSGRSVDGSSHEPDVTVIELGGTIGKLFKSKLIIGFMLGAKWDIPLHIDSRFQATLRACHLLKLCASCNYSSSLKTSASFMFPWSQLLATLVSRRRSLRSTA